MKKILSFVLVAVMIASLAASAVVINVGAESNVSVWDGSASTSLQGSGTKNDPWQINSAADLKYFANTTNTTTTGAKYAGQYVVQNVDIDLNNIEWTPISWKAENSFTGVYDGQGHTISNMKIAQNLAGGPCLGLFGYIGRGHSTIALNADCGVANLNLMGAITIGKDRVGGLVGQINSGAYINNSQKVYIINVTSDVDITVSNYTASGHRWGGIAGYAASAVFENVTNNGDVTVINSNAYTPVGGIAGRAEHIEMIGCVNNGNITLSTTDTSNQLRVGGIVGQIYKENVNQVQTFTNCINNGNVTASLNVATAQKVFAGGIVGGLWYKINDSSKADTWTYSDGSTAGWSNFKTTFTGCVNTGTVYARKPASDTYINAGGILANPYWSGAASDNGGGFTFDGCVNTGEIKATAIDRAAGITGSFWTDGKDHYNNVIKNCVTAKSAGDAGARIYSYLQLGNYDNNIVNNTAKNNAMANALVAQQESLILPSFRSINGMPTGADVAVLKGVKNFSVQLPYTVPETMVVTNAQGVRVTEITDAGEYNVDLMLTGITPYVTDRFALRFDFAYENEDFNADDLDVKFTSGDRSDNVSFAGKVSVFDKYTTYGKTEASNASVMFRNILPHQISNAITMTLTCNGETLFSCKYSLVTYAVNQLGKSAEQLGLNPRKKAQLDNLLVDMLKYGTEDQKLHNFAESRLATNALTDEQLALGTPFSTEGLVSVKAVTTPENQIMTVLYWTSATLVFDNTITMRLRFTVDDWFMTDYSSFNFRLITSSNSIGISNMVKTDDGYYVDITGFSPTEYDDAVSLVFSFENNGGELSDVVTYSVDSYLVNKSESATYGALVRALVSYSASVKAFLG